MVSYINTHQNDCNGTNKYKTPHSGKKRIPHIQSGNQPIKDLCTSKKIVTNINEASCPIMCRAFRYDTALEARLKCWYKCHPNGYRITPKGRDRAKSALNVRRPVSNDQFPDKHSPLWSDMIKKERAQRWHFGRETVHYMFSGLIDPQLAVHSRKPLLGGTRKIVLV